MARPNFDLSVVATTTLELVVVFIRVGSKGNRSGGGPLESRKICACF